MLNSKDNTYPWAGLHLAIAVIMFGWSGLSFIITSKVSSPVGPTTYPLTSIEFLLLIYLLILFIWFYLFSGPLGSRGSKCCSICKIAKPGLWIVRHVTSSSTSHEHSVFSKEVFRIIKRSQELSLCHAKSPYSAIYIILFKHVLVLVDYRFKPVFPETE